MSSLKKDKILGFDIFNFALMIILGLIATFPFYYVFLISFADYAEVQKQLIYIFPTSINLESYKLLLKEDLIFNAFMVSVLVTLSGTLLSITLSSAAAYTLSKRNLPGQKILFFVILIPMFFTGGLIPSYLNIKDLGLTDKFWVLIIPAAISSYNLILLKSFFEEQPESIEESAKMDGANDILILWKIVLPTAAPAIATVSLFYAVDKWNDYYTALLYISNRKLYPLQLVLREAVLDFNQILANSTAVQAAKSSSEIYTPGLRMAIIVLSTIPIFCVYPFLQRHFTKGIMLGSVKE
jgi:ABC-type sugar transport system, permease component